MRSAFPCGLVVLTRSNHADVVKRATRSRDCNDARVRFRLAIAIAHDDVDATVGDRSFVRQHNEVQILRRPGPYAEIASTHAC